MTPPEPAPAAASAGPHKKGNAPSGRSRNVLSHPEFYAACEAVKKHKQQFLDARPTAAEAARMISEFAGFHVSEVTVADIRKATGVAWEPRRAAPKNPKRDADLVVLAAAVRLLFVRLGEKVPAELEELSARLTAG